MELPVAVVTGASSGIGYCAARRLSRLGYHIVMVARDLRRLREAATSLNRPATALAADVADPERARGIIRAAHAELGRVDALINNAGYAPLLPIDKTTDDELAKTFGVNAIGPAALIAEAWPHFVSQRSGCVVNVSSMATRDPFSGFFAYAAAKASLHLMTMSCAKEGAALGIRAFTVAPGAVETPMLRGLFGTDRIPEAACLDPDSVGAVIASCVAGERDAENGGVIWLPSPAASA
jgi:NAD(P)-dependent dehydrogenase (short-subunit alcohol dehydrogenase family)